MKNIKFLFLLILFSASTNLKSQNIIDSINYQLRNYFGNLILPTPQKDFNWDMAAHVVDSTVFSTNFTDTISSFKWEMIYKEMRNSAYDTTFIPSFDSFYEPILNKRKDTIDILTLYFDYYRFKPSALESNTYFNFDTVNNILTDKIPRIGHPYKEHTVFSASPSHQTSNYQNFVFRMDPSLMFYDSFNQLSSLNPHNLYMRVNFNDGNGWQPVSFSNINYFNVDYQIAGKQVINVEIHRGNQFKNLLAKSTSAINTKGFKNNAEDMPNHVLNFSQMKINVYEPCEKSPTGNDKTIIYVEGYDVLEFIASEAISAQDLYNFKIKESGLSDLRNFGYRIIVIDWVKSSQSMRLNSKNLVNLLEYLKCGNIIGGNAVDEEFVIIGESMGGIVASHALLTMEKQVNQNSCYPEKKHNVRLLITNDSPFQGAHIPISLQNIARISYHLVTVTGLRNMKFIYDLILPGFSQYLTRDVLLESDAAKELLSSYASIPSIFLPIAIYPPHPKRVDFMNELNNLGGYPKDCKIVAMSDGNLKGLGQTRYWDGDFRNSGDKLLDLSATTFITILGKKINFIGLGLKLNTDPNGFGNLGSIDMGIYRIRIKLKWFGFRINFNWDNFALLNWNGNLDGKSVASGGILNLNSEVLDSLNKRLSYNGQGHWNTILGLDWLGLDLSLKSDGLHWNFIPVSSALNYNMSVNNLALDNMPVTSFMNNHNIKFDVVYGKKVERISNKIVDEPLMQNINKYNQFHTILINDTLRDNSLTPFQFRKYDYSCSAGFNPNRMIRMLNREIGDNILYLNNRSATLCSSSFTVSDEIHVNVPNPNYNYSNFNSIDALASTYSYNEPFINSNTNDIIRFTTSSSNLIYLPPFSSRYVSRQLDFKNCCFNYKFLNDEFEDFSYSDKQDTKLKLFPNPANNYITAKLTRVEKGYITIEIYDINGKLIQSESLYINDNVENFYLPIQLGSKLNSGLYFLKVVNNNNLYIFI
ncbi:MAG: T9SS type A sorting domain-containing protein [Luteibaculaceae bacterium]